MVNKELLKSVNTSNGHDLLELSHSGPVLLTFLRHFGCVFCREALHDLSARKTVLEESNITLVLVHMSESELAEQYFDEYELPGVNHISDPECKLYARFGLSKGGFSELLGFKNMIRGFEVTLKGKAKPALRFIGDGFQMPGIFMLKDGNVVDRFIHLSAADRPDYDTMIDKVRS